MRISKRNLLVISLICCLFLLALLLPFSMYGQDGYFLWFPIISEYLKGNEIYHASEVIFAGQNLAGIYGELPFWKILRFYQPEIQTFLNLTHLTWLILFYLIVRCIPEGIKGKVNTATEEILLLIYCILSPVIINRAMAGHLNLLFGVLPFFVFTALIFKKNIPFVIIAIFAVWCAMSTQAFQLLFYHLLYIPLLTYLIWKFENNKKKYFLLATLIFFASFLLNFQNLQVMYHHATSPENLRGLNTNNVYSYVTTQFSDIIQLLLSGEHTDLSGRKKFLLHETSYPIGAFILFIVYRKSGWIVTNLTLMTIGFLFLFSMNIFPFNLLSEVLIFSPFRVPQRSMMMGCLFLPVWIMGQFELKLSRKEWAFALLILVSSQLIVFFEVIIFGAVAGMLLIKKYYNPQHALVLALLGLNTGSVEKILPAIEFHKQYEIVAAVLKPLTQKFTEQELRKTKFHFETPSPLLVNYVAQTMGIATIEGYGHPPKKIIDTVEKMLMVDIRDTANDLYLVGNFSQKDEVLKALGVTKIVLIENDNKLVIKDL